MLAVLVKPTVILPERVLGVVPVPVVEGPALAGQVAHLLSSTPGSAPVLLDSDPPGVPEVGKPPPTPAQTSPGSD